MSFDIFVQGFLHGDARDVDVKLARVALTPYLVKNTHGWNLRAAGSTAEIYGVENLAKGFMVTHVDGAEIYDLLVEVVKACDLVMLPVGCPAVLARAEQRDHLPEEFRDTAVVVTSGAELVALIVSS